MFEVKSGTCPACGLEIRKTLAADDEYECPSCQKDYTVFMDKGTVKVWLVQVEDSRLQEPLFLPRGSLRAVTTLVLAGCCWVLILINQEVPSYLLSLLLTVIGYYFGFRKRQAVSGGQIYDAQVHKAENPLFLPAGYIRVSLILGFLVSGGVLLVRGQLANLAYLEFFLILAGFVVGYFFARIMAHLQDETAAYNFMLHLKGLILLGAVLILTVMLLTLYYQQHAYSALACACVISFYFGSRS